MTTLTRSTLDNLTELLVEWREGDKAALDRLILDCLEKNPDNRPATADAVTARLAAVELAVPWTSEDARQWWERFAKPEKSV